MPNLIANDLVIVKPMAAMSGYIQYVQFVAGSNKGGVVQGEVFNDPFRLGRMTEASEYTSRFLSETVTVGVDGAATLAWSPVTEVALVGAESGASVEIVDAAKGTIKVTGAIGSVKVRYIYDNGIITTKRSSNLKCSYVRYGIRSKTT